MFIDTSDPEFYYETVYIMTNPTTKYRFLGSLDLENEIKLRLSQHLQRIELGNDMVYLTPIAKDHKPESILKEWDKIYNSKLNLINKTLQEIEESNRLKFGPRSIAKPWKSRRDSTFEYFNNSKSKTDISYKFAKRSLRPISLSNASKLLQNTSNSGLPYYIKKGLVKDKAVLKFDELLKRKDPCILFTRTQEADKTRDVWGYPIADTLNELRYYSPLLEYQKGLNWRSVLISPDQVDKSISKMILDGRKQNLTFLSIDFSGFDKSVSTDLQRISFNYIKSLFQDQFSDDLDYIKDRFNTIGLVTPSGILEGSHGVPSGSTFTNEVDSVVQYLIAINSNLVKPEYIQIQGDDGAYGLIDSNVDKLINCFELEGLKVNKDKSNVSKDYLVYLQRLYHIDYMKDDFIGGIYSTYRALNRILYQERYSDFEEYQVKGIDYYSIRTISILENVKYHPLFEDFVKFIKKYDKYSLKFSQDGLNKFNKMNLQADGNVGTIKNQYGSTTKGIRSFESYKIINS